MTSTPLIVNRLTTASFDVDAQRGFTPLCPDELPVPEGHLIAEPLNQQATFAAFRIGSKDAHSAHAVWVATDSAPQLSPVIGHANADLHWHRHCEPGTPGFELLEGLPHDLDYDFFVYKGVAPDVHPYGACYHDLANRRTTGVIEFLRSRGVDTVIVGGLATDFCVKTTVLQLLDAGFRVIVNMSACRGLSEDGVRTAVEAMTAAGAVVIDGLSNVSLNA